MCDLQTQGKRGGVGFNWGELSNDYPFLPRVTYKNVILGLARWNIRKEDIKELVKIKDDAQLLEKMKAWRQSIGMPALVGLLDGDNELLINLDNALCVRTLFSVVKQRTGFQLVEFLFHKDRAPVKNGDGVFTNEFIFSFYKKPADKG